jgi:predicted extracellular nuclease
VETLFRGAIPGPPSPLPGSNDKEVSGSEDMSRITRMAAAAALFAAATTSHAAVYVTEWMYNGATNGEFVEFTNLGPDVVDFTGWSFDDSSRTAGSVNLSAFGTVAAGESVILAESTAAAFRAAWGLAASVKVIGGNTNNLGRADEINLYDATSTLVDRLTYDDQTIAGTIRTQFRSGNPTALADLMSNTVTSGWLLSTAGDANGSIASTPDGDIGNPGQFRLAAVPEPSTYMLMLAGLAAIFGVARRRTL